MSELAFPYDVFLSHSAKDKPVVRPLAERLRQDGLKAWFQQIRNSNPEIRNKSESPNEENSKHVAKAGKATLPAFPMGEFVLVSDFGFRASDFAQPGPFRFRDPLNRGALGGDKRLKEADKQA